MSDAGLKYLKGLTQLRALYLYRTKVSDAGLQHLAGLTQLNKLELGDTRVTAAGRKKLKQALPNCTIIPRHDHCPGNPAGIASRRTAASRCCWPWRAF